MAKTVVVGMSGGVDSSVAALLLKEQGYNVIGLFMLNWEETENDCCTAQSDYEDVKRVCSKIGIPYYTINFAKEYMDRVFKYFLEEYSKGRTPNPDVLCNREIKFGPFLEHARRLGADYIATGHYCDIEHGEDGYHYLLKAVDDNKDQTYFLNQLSQDQLKDVLFPLGKLNKEQVREIALKNDFVTAKKKDSTGICFIGERNFRKFLKEYLPAKAGKIVDEQGNVVGEHEGVMYYTLGQRRGLNIGGKSGGTGERWFVLDKDVENNLLIVSQGEGDNLFSDALISNKVNWIPHTPKENNFDCYAKFRYRQPDQKVNVTLNDDGTVYVKFYEKQRAVTTGQYVVFYNETMCLGGGVIDKVIKE